MTFFQGTTAHCEQDALAYIRRDNVYAESIELVSRQYMGARTLFRFKVTTPRLPKFTYELDDA